MEESLPDKNTTLLRMRSRGIKSERESRD